MSSPVKSLDNQGQNRAIPGILLPVLGLHCPCTSRMNPSRKLMSLSYGTLPTTDADQG